MKATSNLNPRPIRNSRTPLTLDQIRQAAPSAFAQEAFGGMSSRYSYIPTSDVIEGMMATGFQVFAASQSATRVDEKRGHTKHMIRFRSANMAPAVGEIFPEVVLINSHDGSSAYKLMAGLFRLVCGNGMVVANSLVSELSIRHSGNVIEQVASGSVEIVEDMPRVIDAVARWREIQLSASEQNAFAEAAHTLRFADADGRISTPIRPEQLLRSRRSDDMNPSLWHTLNRVQENVIRGGLRAYVPGTLNRRTSRAVSGIETDVRLNRALWVLAERLAESKN